MDPKSNHQCHKRADKRKLTHRKGEKDVKTEAEIGVCDHKQKNAGSHQKLEEARNKVQPCSHLEFNPEKLILNFWSPELWKNKFFLFSATKFVVICHYSHRKPIHTIFFWIHRFVDFFGKDFIYLFLERGKGGRKRGTEISMCERYIDQLPLMRLQPGTWPVIQACALTSNWTGNLLVQRPALNPLSYTSQGRFVDF